MKVRSTRYFILMSAVLLFVAASSSAATVPLPNGGFENAAASGAASWSVAGVPHGRVARDAAVRHAGDAPRGGAGGGGVLEAAVRKRHRRRGRGRGHEEQDGGHQDEVARRSNLHGPSFDGARIRGSYRPEAGPTTRDRGSRRATDRERSVRQASAASRRRGDADVPHV